MKGDCYWQHVMTVLVKSILDLCEQYYGVIVLGWYCSQVSARAALMQEQLAWVLKVKLHEMMFQGLIN
jgi:hypothetical protein